MAIIKAPADCEFDAKMLKPLVFSSFQPPEFGVALYGRSPLPGVSILTVGTAPALVPKRCMATPAGNMEAD